jgi:hypothetical protein
MANLFTLTNVKKVGAKTYQTAISVVLPTAGVVSVETYTAPAYTAAVGKPLPVIPTDVVTVVKIKNEGDLIGKTYYSTTAKATVVTAIG